MRKNKMEIEDKIKILRLEKIISIYEGKLFDVLYDRIIYCNICKLIININELGSENIICNNMYTCNICNKNKN